MRPQLLIPAILGVALLLSGPAGAAGTNVDDVAKSKAVYTTRLREIRQDAETAKADLLARYRKDLDALRLAAKQKGDLEAVQAADAEIARFQKEKVLPAAADTPASADLAKGIGTCRDQLDKADLDRARKVVQLTDQYLQFLDQRVRLAVQGDKLDVAKAYKSEMDAARETPDYQAAKFLVGEKQTQAEAAKPDAPAAKPPDSKAPDAGAPKAPPAARTGDNGERLQPRIDPDGLYDALSVAEGIPALSLTQPSAYKKLLASETGKAAYAGGVGIDLDGYLEAGNARYHLRAKLRPKASGDTFQNVKVLVQYFMRTSNGGAVQESRVQFTQVPTVGAKHATCELKPVDLTYTVRYRGFGSFSEDRDGNLVGVVVSAFSADDKLLGQVMSNATLKEKGRTTFERPPDWVMHVYESSAPPDMRPPRFRIIRTD